MMEEAEQDALKQSLLDFDDQRDEENDEVEKRFAADIAQKISKVSQAKQYLSQPDEASDQSKLLNEEIVDHEEDGEVLSSLPPQPQSDPEVVLPEPLNQPPVILTAEEAVLPPPPEIPVPLQQQQSIPEAAASPKPAKKEKAEKDKKKKSGQISRSSPSPSGGKVIIRKNDLLEKDAKSPSSLSNANKSKKKKKKKGADSTKDNNNNNSTKTFKPSRAEEEREAHVAEVRKKLAANSAASQKLQNYIERRKRMLSRANKRHVIAVVLSPAGSYVPPVQNASSVPSSSFISANQSSSSLMHSNSPGKRYKGSMAASSPLSSKQQSAPIKRSAVPAPPIPKRSISEAPRFSKTKNSNEDSLIPIPVINDESAESGVFELTQPSLHPPIIEAEKKPASLFSQQQHQKRAAAFRASQPALSIEERLPPIPNSIGSSSNMPNSNARRLYRPTPPTKQLPLVSYQSPGSGASRGNKPK